jgi:hypothetical protein
VSESARSSPSDADQTRRAAFRNRFRPVPTILSTALVVALAAAVAFGALFTSESATGARTAHTLSVEKARLKTVEATVASLTQQVIQDQSAVAAAADSAQQIRTLKSQLAACKTAATDFGAQAIADALIAVNPNGDNTVNLNVATTEQNAGNATGCLPTS